MQNRKRKGGVFRFIVCLGPSFPTVAACIMTASAGVESMSPPPSAEERINHLTHQQQQYVTSNHSTSQLAQRKPLLSQQQQQQQQQPSAASGFTQHPSLGPATMKPPPRPTATTAGARGPPKPPSDRSKGAGGSTGGTTLPSRVSQIYYKHGLFLSSYPTTATSFALAIIIFCW